MKMLSDADELLCVRKETLWMTNSEQIASELQGVCQNKLKARKSIDMYISSAVAEQKLRKCTRCLW